MIEKDLLKFLKTLKANNDRDWFNANKPVFKSHEADAKAFFKEAHEKLALIDQIEGHKLMRIYRDVRFSKDKTPYKPRFAGSFSRSTAALRGSYYLNIEPGNSIVGGGFYGPNTDDLKRIRQEFEMDDTEIRAILNDKKFKATFGELRGEGLKTAPRGFDPENKAIDLIRKKQFYVIREFTDKEVLQEDFIEKVVETCQVILPYFDYMSSVLTTNSNGESIL
ncbi:MAG: TIGR02453 family protein [Crocinitomix sp.]|nr:TIGR02453 family protein [Crocinitomix sp.]